MRRIATACAALLMMAAMAAGLAGCGEAYDPTGLVKANLDYMTRGETTDEILSETDQPVEELKKLYEEELNSSVDEVMQELQAELGVEATEEMRALVKTFIADALKKTRYEVKEAFTEKEGVYYVDVDVYPMDLLTTIEEWIEGETYLAEWEDKIVSGEYVYTTDEKLMQDIYNYVFDKVSAFVDETEYLDPVTMTVKVEEKNGVYMPNQEDLDAIGATAMGE